MTKDKLGNEIKVGDIIIRTVFSSDLSIGGKYKVLETVGPSVVIINNSGGKDYYDADRFTIVKEILNWEEELRC